MLASTRFTRRQALAALALLPSEYVPAAGLQPPAAPKPETPPPASVAPVIAQATKLTEAKKFAEAIALLDARQKALGATITKDEKRALRITIADTQNAWANDAFGRDQNREVIEHLQSAYAIDKEYRPQDAATELGEIGQIYSALGEMTRALDYYNQVLPLFQTLGDKRGEATALINLGFVYNILGENAKSLDYYGKALSISHAIGDKRGEASALINQGVIYASLGENAKTLDVFNQALPLFQAIGDKNGEATTLNNMGSVYSDFGETEKSLDYFKKALPLRQAIGNKSGEAVTLNNIGSVYSDFGEKSNALDYYNQALSIQKAISDKAGEAKTLIRIGLVYRELGDMPKALDDYNKALLLLRDVGDKMSQASVLNNLGGVYRELGDMPKALDDYNKALSLFQALGYKSGEETVTSNIGSIYSKRGENAKALEFLNKALTISRAIGDKKGEAGTLTYIGGVYQDLGEGARALDFFNQALPIRQALGDKAGEANTTEHLMSVFNDAKNPLNNPALAVTFGKQAVNLYQGLRANIKTLDKALQATFTKSVEPTYRELADILIRLGRLPEAQQVLGLLKEQEFADFLRRDAKLADGTPLADLTPREFEAKKRYDSAGEKITALSAEFDTVSRSNRLTPTDANKRRLAEINRLLGEAQAEFLRVLAAITSEFQAAKKNDSLDKLKNVQETENLTTTLGTLSEQTKQSVVAVYTLVAPERLHCLIVTPNAQIARSTPIKDTYLNKLVQDFRTALEDTRLDPRPLGKKLYDLLIAPIEADLKGAKAKSILWSLDGTLRYLPLAALSPDGKTYLVERDTQSSLFTPATLQNLKDDNKKNWNAAAFGVTQKHVENGLTFAALPGVSEEIKAVGLTVPTQSLLDEAFTEESFREVLQSRPPLVHIASHFAFLPANPTASFLLLGKGTLSLDTITRLRVGLFIGVDLLTLSACDTATGGGANENGAEVESFALLAQKKGAGAVLASLWPVNDTSTQAMMQTFYALHKAHPTLGKAECLRQTQVALLRGTVKPILTKRSAEMALPSPGAGFVKFASDPNAPCAHPFYWAAFTLIGNTK